MKKRVKAVYPSKVTLNLAMREKSPFSPVKLLPALVLLAALALLFGKFAVADRLAAVDKAQGELAALKEQSAQLEAATAGYDELLELYSHYSVGWMTDEEKLTLPRTELLDLIESELMPASQVRRFSVSGNVLSVELGGITLNDTSRIVQRLYQRPDVTNVAVYTASTKTEKGDQAAVSMVITLAPVQEGGTGK